MSGCFGSLQNCSWQCCAWINSDLGRSGNYQIFYVLSKLLYESCTGPSSTKLKNELKQKETKNGKNVTAVFRGERDRHL